jgi:histidine triad (HIT) family protein
MDCVFCKIVRGEAEARIVYRDDHVTAFEDIAPQAPTHIVLVPNRHIRCLNEVVGDEEGLLADLLMAAQRVAELAGLTGSGYRLVINTGRDAGQSVPHLHVHVLGGRRLKWPPG